MSTIVFGSDQQTAGPPRFRFDAPRVLITGACRGIGRACVEVLAARGAQVILADRDEREVTKAADAFGADPYFCDVASEAQVASFAHEVGKRYSWLDMVINAAGGGYERTLGMYRVSRALLPALRQGSERILLNIPPSAGEAEAAIFPYASSRLAFQRLSSALALETRSSSVTVLIGCPAARRIIRVLPDPDARNWAEDCLPGRATRDEKTAFAWQVASLVGRHNQRRKAS